MTYEVKTVYWSLLDFKTISQDVCGVFFKLKIRD
jgi:hypothetical protein